MNTLAKEQFEKIKAVKDKLRNDKNNTELQEELFSINKELKENALKMFSNESDIKRVKRDQIKEIIDAIDNWYGWDWNYDWFFDNKREYQWMPTVIFWKGNDLRVEVLNNRVISFHQLKNRNWYRHVPTGRLPLSPIRMKAAWTL